MSENDFYVAIQGILDNALRSGRSLEWLDLHGCEAIAEFIGIHEEEDEE